MKIGVVEFHAASRCCWNFSPSRKKSLFRSPQAPGPWFFDLWEWSFHVISGIFVYGCHLYSLNTSFLSLNMLNANVCFLGEVGLRIQVNNISCSGRQVGGFLGWEICDEAWWSDLGRENLPKPNYLLYLSISNAYIYVYLFIMISPIVYWPIRSPPWNKASLQKSWRIWTQVSHCPP